MSLDEAKRKDYALVKANQVVFRKAIEFTMEGNVSELEKVLMQCKADSGEDYSMHDIVVGFQSEGKTLLHIAAGSGKVEVLRCLLSLVDAKQVVNLQDHKGMTLLINATISESLPAMQLLLDSGADVNLRTVEGATALHFACSDGNLTRIDLLLLTASADVTLVSTSGSVLHWAAAKGHAEALRRLLAHPKGSQLLDLPDSNGVPAVFMAAVHGCDASVALLVQAGADVGAVLSGGITLLHICSEHGLVQAVQALLGTPSGVKCASLPTAEGHTPMYLAAMAGHREVVELLAPVSGVSTPEEVQEVMAEGARRMAAYHTPSPKEEVAAAVPEIKEVSEAALREAEQAKEAGNAAFKAKAYPQAIVSYSAALALHPTAAVHSNRSAAFIAIGDPQAALQDAEACRRLDPSWAKGAFRLATARLALGMYEDAALAAFEGCKLEPANKELKELMQEAVRRGQEDHKRRQAAAAAQLKR